MSTHHFVRLGIVVLTLSSAVSARAYWVCGPDTYGARCTKCKSSISGASSCFESNSQGMGQCSEARCGMNMDNHISTNVRVAPRIFRIAEKGDAITKTGKAEAASKAGATQSRTKPVEACPNGMIPPCEPSPIPAH